MERRNTIVESNAQSKQRLTGKVGKATYACMLSRLVVTGAAISSLLGQLICVDALSESCPSRPTPKLFKNQSGVVPGWYSAVEISCSRWGRAESNDSESNEDRVCLTREMCHRKSVSS